MSGLSDIIETSSGGSWDKLSTPTILSPELALPLTSGCLVSHGQASLNLLSCLDTLCQLPDANLTANEDETTKAVAQKSHSKEDYSVVNRSVSRSVLLDTVII